MRSNIHSEGHLHGGPETVRRAIRMTVSEVMSTDLLAAHADDLVEEVRRRADGRAVHHVVVVHQDGDLMGMLCRCDMDDTWPEARVRDRMSSCPLFTGPHETLAAAAETMEDYGVGSLPVVDTSGHLVGIVTRSDLRAHGVLPDLPGVDRCAACGTGHGLCPRRANEICFCRSCVDAGKVDPEDPNVTLGEGD